MELAVKKVNNGILITADTIVVLNKQIIGKPKNEKDAFKILSALSGETHFVYTGFCLYNFWNCILKSTRFINFHQISDAWEIVKIMQD